MELVVIPLDELEQMIEKILAKNNSKPIKKPEAPVPTSEMKRLMKIKDHRAFRRRVKQYKAKSVGKIGREDGWLPSSFNIQI